MGRAVIFPALPLVFPLVFPLQIQNTLYEALHALGAVLSHAFGDMPISVQRESGGSVSKIALYTFHIIPGSERVYRKSMSGIMETDSLQPSRLCQ